MKLGVYSGTFDPIHNGHIAVATGALKYVDKVAFIVEPKPRHKNGVTSLGQREEMVELAIAQNPRIVLLENQNKDKPHDSKGVLASISKMIDLDSVRLFWVMGADTFLKYRAWDDFTHRSDYEYIVSTRGNSTFQRLVGAKSVSGLSVQIMKINSTESSSEVRAGNLSLVPEGVTSYIKKNKLYTVS